MLNRCSCWGLLEAILKKKVRQLHIVGKLATTENLQSNTHKKKNRCNCTFTPTGGHSTRRKNKWFEQWIQSWRDKVHWNDSFWQNYCHLEDLGKKKKKNYLEESKFWPHPTSNDGAGWRGVKLWINSVVQDKEDRVEKKWDSLYLYFSCVLFML